MKLPAPTADHQLDQLVVATSHLDEVRAELDRWEVSATVKDEDARLGLALVTADLGRAAAYVRANRATLFRNGPAPVGVPDLELACQGLRAAFRNTWQWEPTLGKNRLLRDVGGHYVIGIGVPSAHYVIGIGGVESKYVIGIGSEPEAADGPADGFGSRTGDAGAGARVAVVDTGLLANPWLAGGYRCSAESLLPDPDEDGPLAAHHGTFVTGLVLRQAPAADVWIEGGLDTSGHRESWDLALTLARLADRGADIVNLSLGCTTDDNAAPLVLRRAVECLGSQTLVVAAAGNYEPNEDDVRPRPMWPAAMESVVAVGSVDADGQASAFSPRAPWVDLRFPGEHVVSTFGGSTDRFPAFAHWSGTSFAAASASGWIAAEKGPGETATQTWRRLQSDGGR